MFKLILVSLLLGASLMASRPAESIPAADSAVRAGLPVPQNPGGSFPATPASTPTQVASRRLSATAPELTVLVNANLRAGAGTTYRVVGGARAGAILPVTGRTVGWYQVWWRGQQAWIHAGLVRASAAAQHAPWNASPAPAQSVPTTPPTRTPSALPELVVLGPDTVYPVRAQVVRGWDYEFIDVSAQYDLEVYRDVFGMLAHQIDDENRKLRPDKKPIASNGPIRITLIDAAPHPDAGCPGWGWAPERATYAGDPFGLPQDPCLVEHSLRPEADGHGAVLLTGWSYADGRTIAVGAYGPTAADWSTTYIAERITRPAAIGPADRPDFSQPLYAPLGRAAKVDGRWTWTEPFVRIVPAQIR